MAESTAEPQLADEQHTNGNGTHQQNGTQLPAWNTSQDPEKVENPPANPWMDPKAFPDGGAKAWLTVAGASACLFVSFGWVNCVGVFQDYYQTHQLQQYTSSEISWIPALQSGWSPFYNELNVLTTTVFCMLFGGPFVGKIFDDYGPQYLLAVGAFLHVFGLMMASISTEYYQILLSQALCSAIGASMVFYPAFTCVSSASNPLDMPLMAHPGIDVVLSKARRGPRPCRGWIIVRRGYSSYNGRSSDSRSRFRMGNAYLRLPDLSTSHFCKRNCALPHRTNEASIQPHGFHSSLEGAEFCAFDCSHFLLLL